MDDWTGLFVPYVWPVPIGHRTSRDRRGYWLSRARGSWREIRRSPLLTRATATMRCGLLLPALLAAFAPAHRSLDAQEASPATSSASVTGTVRDSAGATIAGAIVTLNVPGQAPRTSRTSANGAFTFRGLGEGTVHLHVTRLGYRPQDADATAPPREPLEIVMVRVAVPLSQVVVSPGRFGVLKDPTEGLSTSQTLSREALQATPQLGEDIYRAVVRLPGVSSTDYSARFRVRNGANDEMLVLLDGLELHEPFHLKDFDGALSIVDVAAVGGIDLIAGGFPAQYGDRLTGVFDIATRRPTDGDHTSFGLSVSNLRGSSRGTFDDGRGSWLLSARRGYLDLVFKIIGEENPPRPVYYDVLAKADYRLGTDHLLAAHVLEAADHTNFIDEDGTTAPDDELESRYGNRYGWLTLDSDFMGGRLHGRTLAAGGRLSWNRIGRDFTRISNSPVTYAQRMATNDQRSATVGQLKEEVRLEITPSVVLQAGGQLDRWSSDYDYLNWLRRTVASGGNFVVRYDTTAARATLDGKSLGLFSSVRVRPTRSLTLEAGLRHDHTDWSGDNVFSPRFNAAWELGPATTLRGAIGRYAQSQRVYELQALDGETTFYPAELAIHRGLGLEHTWAERGLTARVEAYDREITRPRPHWMNLDMDLEVFGETEWDRVRLAPTSADVRGLELFAQTDESQRFSWSASWALSKATQVLNGATIPREFDQRHAVSAEGAWRPGRAWRLSAAFSYHSGWPVSIATFNATTRTNANGSTSVLITRDNRTVNDERLPSYHRVDLRATRTFRVGRTEIQAFADLFNAFNESNTRGYIYRNVRYVNGQVLFDRDHDLFLPRLPSIGVTVEF